MREALTVERAGTYLLVEVDHIPTRGLHQGGQAAEAACRRLPLEPCKRLGTNGLQMFIDSGY